MFTEKGYITYSTKNKPDKTIVRDVLKISYRGNLTVLYLSHDNKTTLDTFMYEPKYDKWFVPGRKDKYGECKWKEFEGKVFEVSFWIGYKNNIE